jgi:hypothetical protein
MKNNNLPMNAQMKITLIRILIFGGKTCEVGLLPST